MSQPSAEQIIKILETLRMDLVDYESQIHLAIASVLRKNHVQFQQEVRIGSRRRIDFLVGEIGIEVKKGKPSLNTIIRQAERYCESDRIKELILVVERGLFDQSFDSIEKPVYCVTLTKQWGIAT